MSPNKTLYVRDDDLPVWERAESYAKATRQSVSALVAAALSRYLPDEPDDDGADTLALERAVYALHDAGSVKGQIAQMFHSAASWRQSVAEEFPGDSRNAPAARHMYRIAAGLIALPDGDPRLEAVEAAWDACLRADRFPDTLNDVIRGYGFGWGGHGAYYPDVAEVLARIRGELEGAS